MNGDAPALRLGFAGTPETARDILQALVERGRYEIGLVVTRPDRPAGRGQRIKPGPVAELAARLGLPLWQPASSAELARGSARLCTLDLLVTVAYGFLLPEGMLSAPRLGCINVHYSLLPRWRGAAPIQHALLHGDRETGVSIIRLERGLDTGPLLRRQSCPIGDTATAAELLKQLTHRGRDCLLETLREIGAGQARIESQDERYATYAPRIAKEQARIDWVRQTAAGIERMVRAFNPAPVACADFLGLPLRVWEASLGRETDVPPGGIVAAGERGIEIAASDGRAVRLLVVQAPGKRAMPAGDFVRGYRAGIPCREAQ